MSDDITQRDYWNEVNDVAKDIVDEAWTEHGDDEDRRREAMTERTWETVDGHQWIIYTHYNPQVLEHASNPDAYAENYGEMPTGEGYGGLMAKLAYAAFEEDVNNKVYELDREREGEQEEAEEEGGIRLR